MYNVILLFIESKTIGHQILSDKVRYRRIIKQVKQEYREHVIKVIEIFDPNFRITTEELEERYNIKFDFPNIIYHELNTFIMDNDGRINFTNQNCVTIDGENTTCLDDALYIEKNSDGTHTLYIHIADIPVFVPYTSLLNEESRKRIETLYLRDKHINLYPEIISDRMCSLLPNNNRNVITYIYKLDSKCKLIDEYPNVVKGKIRVRHKLSHEDVDKRIENLTNDDLDMNFINKRISMLENGLVEILIGAFTDTERREKKMRCDDALYAINSSLEGVLPGSGIKLYEFPILNSNGIKKDIINSTITIIVATLLKGSNVNI